MRQLEYQEAFALVLEVLKSKPRGQFGELCEGVAAAATSRGLLPKRENQSYGFARADAPVEALVRQAYWECVAKGLIVPGMDSMNPQWPWYAVTARGGSAVANVGAQPYDRDGFIAYFRRLVGSVDPVVDAYFVEAVEAFNSGCQRSAAVMLGVASEQLVLLLADAFTAAIEDGDKKSKLEKELAKAWQINVKYRAIKERLELVVDAKRLPVEHAETVGSELGGVFELLRRYRNANGHPTAPTAVDADTIFLNLRTFIEYARRVTSLIRDFTQNPVNW